MDAQKGRFVELDIFRGVCAVFVVIYHFSHFYFTGTFQPELYQDLPFERVLAPLYERGVWFVEVFFSISGYVFFWLYRDAIHNRSVTGRQFFVARFARLYPLYFATLIFAAVMMAVFVSVHGFKYVYAGSDAKQFVLSLFMVQEWMTQPVTSFNGPAWSISVEVFLYVLFFVFAYFRGGPWALLGVLAVSLILRALLPDLALWRGPLSFFLGGAAFWMAQWIRKQSILPFARVVAAVTVIGGWSAAYALTYPGVVTLPDSLITKMLVLGAFTIVLVPMTLLCLDLWRQAAPPPALKAFAWLGDISYSIYLLHFPFQMVVMLGLLQLSPDSRASVLASPVFFIGFFAILVPLSIGIFHAFEMPVRRWLVARLSPRRSDLAT